LGIGSAQAQETEVDQLARLTESEARFVFESIFVQNRGSNPAIRGLPDKLSTAHIDVATEILARVQLVNDIGLQIPGALLEVLDDLSLGVVLSRRNPRAFAVHQVVSHILISGAEEFGSRKLTLEMSLGIGFGFKNQLAANYNSIVQGLNNPDI